MNWNSLFPHLLWTRRFTVAWIASLVTILAFDLMWMAQTTFRPFTFLAFYPYLLLGATLMAWPAMVSKRVWPMALWLFIVDGVMIANLMYCRTYFNAIPAQSYLLASNLQDFGPSVADSFRWYFLALPVVTIATIFVMRARREKWRPMGFPYLVTVIVLGLLAWLADCWRGGPMGQIDRLSRECYKATCIAPIYHIPGFLAHDLLKASDVPTAEEVAQAEAWIAAHKAQQQWAVPDSIPHPSNLVVIFCESLESWPLNKSVEQPRSVAASPASKNTTEITPFLNSLLADSTTLYFPNVVTQVGAGRSIDAQLLMLAGMMPPQGQVYAFSHPDYPFSTIPKAMKAERPTRSYLLTCDKPHVWNQTLVARAFGVDTLLSSSSWDNTDPVGTARRLSDGEFMRQSVEKMRHGEIWPQGENAFMLWVTYSGHNPFRLPEHLQKIKVSEDYPTLLRDYIITANYTDGALKTLVDYLRSRPDWDRTMVVITGDHEGLAADRRKLHRAAPNLVDPGDHTPLIILNAPVHGTYPQEIGQIDVYTTLLDLMGLHSYPWTGLGSSALGGPAFDGLGGPAFDGLTPSQVSSILLRQQKP
ncbi:MAG: LTA synthase family protein [Bacteroidales bacterium]|nr:LTA synthase family protein [Bacteroidales bacterium]